ncbi:MAG TPA: GNAT family N-acetyltransferase [Elainellaceae cyanobacterium]
MTIVAESDRLILRDWNPETEAERAFEIYGDPDVMRYIGNGATQESVESMQAALRNRANQIIQLNDGSGFWAIFDKLKHDLVGTILLKRLPDGNQTPTSDWEVGWHLKKSAWGNGYATEGGRMALDYGFYRLKLPIIYAVTNPENTASIRVARRLGMIPKGRTTRYYGINLNLNLFELKHPSHD